MARHLEKTPKGDYRETITNINQCRWLYDEVCCNDRCDIVADYPDPELYCKRRCKFYEKEIEP